MSQGAGTRGYMAPSGGVMTAEQIEDLLGGAAFASPNASLSIAYDDPGNRWTFDINTAHTNVWSVQQEFNGDGGASVSTGGSVNISDFGTGAGLVIYSSRGADALGRVLAVKNDNVLNTQALAIFDYEGVGSPAVIIRRGPVSAAQDSTAEALDIQSTNRLDTTVGIQGVESGRGTVKITHMHPVGAAANDDANAAILRLNWEDDSATPGTSVQGLYMYSEDGSPLVGDAIRMYNGASGAGTEILRLTAGGQLRVPQESAAAGLLLGADALLVNDGTDLSVTPPIGGTLTLDLTDDNLNVVQINLDTAIDGIYNPVFGIGVGQTITPSAASFGVRALTLSGIFVHTLAHLGTPYLVFNFNATAQLVGAGGGGASTVNLGNVTTYQNSPTFSLESDNLFGDIGTSNGRSFLDAVTFQRGAGGPAATATVAAWSSFHSAPTFDAGITVTADRRVRIQVAAGAGTITTEVGVDIQDLNTYPGTLTNRAMGIRTIAPILMGIAGTMTNVSAGIEIQSTTQALLVSRMTGAQMNALTAADGMIVYVTDNATVAGPNFYSRNAGAWVAGV